MRIANPERTGIQYYLQSSVIFVFLYFMKVYILFICAILTACLFSCQKKENVKPAIVPTKDSTIQTTLVYPYTDTFTGNITEVQSYEGMPGTGQPYTIDTAVVFYIVFLNANKMVFMSRDSIHYQYGAFMVRDTFMANPYGSYLAGTDPSRIRQYTGDNFTYYYTSVILSYNWSFYEPAGCTDIMIHSRTYTGQEVIR